MGRRSRDPRIVSFGNELGARMAARGLSQRVLGERVGVTQPMVGYWVRGEHLPTLDMGRRLADVLMDETLVPRLVEARVGRCPCGRSFDRGATRRLYCSWTCQVRANQKGGKPVDLRQSAIDAMCRGCEPEGICRDDGCALRPFSPLLVIPLRRAS